MIQTHWSWIFILCALQLGGAAIPNEVYTNISVRDGTYESSYSVSAPTMSRTNVGILVGCIAGGMALSFAVLGWCFVSRSRRVATHVEEGIIGPGLKKSTDGWLPTLKSEFSPDEKSIRGFDRIREALTRQGAKKSQQSILPIYQVSLPTGSTDSVERPPPVAPHKPRYPSMLERGYSKRPHPPPLTLHSHWGHPRTSSLANSPEDEDRWKRVQTPPKALFVPPGRPLPGFTSSQSAGLRLPKSPSRRRSWLSKHPFKHPFIPVRDSALRFPPGSPLHPGQYQPSRWQLEARHPSRSPLKEAISSRLGPSTVKEATKQGRLTETLQSDNRRPPLPKTPQRTANISRSPLSSRYLPRDQPTTAYI